MNETLWFDFELGEYVGLDVLRREHFGLMFAACLERVNEANRVIADDMRLQPELYDDDCTCSDADAAGYPGSTTCPACQRAGGQPDPSVEV